MALHYHIQSPEPSDAEARKEYVARVAIFSKDILRDELEFKIMEQMRALQNPTNTREMDLEIKGAINAYSLLLDWCDSMESQAAAGQLPDEVAEQSAFDTNLDTNS